MATLALTFTDSGFPDPFTGDVQDEVDAFVAHLAASITDTKLILGQNGGTIPGSNIGPLWINGTSIYVWDGATYTPVIIKLLNSTHLTTFGSETLTADRVITFPDKDGIAAMQSDVFNTRGTHVVTGGTTPDFDWSVASSFYRAVNAANDTATFSNSLPGQEIIIVTFAAAAYTIAFPVIVEWKTPGTQPVQTSTATDMWRFTNLAGTIYGERVGANFS